MAVRIRMKKMGRRHRPFYRICAVDSRQPRDGRVLEEVGTYDPMVPETDARALLNRDRVKYWLDVGALPTEKCKALIKKYGPDGTHVEKQRQALDRLAQQRRRPEPPPRAQPTEEPGEPSAEPDMAAAEVTVDTPTGIGMEGEGEQPPE